MKIMWDPKQNPEGLHMTLVRLTYSNRIGPVTKIRIKSNLRQNVAISHVKSKAKVEYYQH